MTINRVECWVFRAPIEVPISTAFGTMTSRPALFLRISASDGAWGWGEVFCNFPQVGAEHPHHPCAYDMRAPDEKGHGSEEVQQGLHVGKRFRFRELA